MADTVENSIRLVAVKFRTAGRHYDFNAQNLDFGAGDRVIVETDRGRALGTVVLPPAKSPGRRSRKISKTSSVRPRTMTLPSPPAPPPREGDAFRFCQQRIQDRKMEMKLVGAEFLFDGSKIIFYFTADGRVDFRELVKDLAHHFHTRIEMRQIGVRDEAKLTGGIGICGRELCCCTFLNEFAPVSVKMAKEQGLALNPNKISGQCGRLLCCLAYEFETYCAMKKGLPKCGRRIQLAGREMEVLEQNVLSQTVTVRQEDGKIKELTADELERKDPEAAAQPVEGVGQGTEPRRREESRPEDGKRSKGPRPPRSKNAPRSEQAAASSPAGEPAAAAPTGEPPSHPEGKRKRGRRRSRRKQ